jgi:serine protease Do
VVGELEKHGSETWGWLGISIKSVSAAIAKSLGLDPEHPERTLVASVSADNAAAKAGLKTADVIVAQAATRSTTRTICRGCSRKRRLATSST